jgi:hypothetical protein
MGSKSPGRAAFGNRRDAKGNIQTCPVEAAAVSRCVQLLANRSVARATERLRLEGYSRPSGEQITASIVSATLTNKIVVGIVVWRERPDPVYARAEHLRIVPDEDWTKAGIARLRNAGRPKRSLSVRGRH